VQATRRIGLIHPVQVINTLAMRTDVLFIREPQPQVSNLSTFLITRPRGASRPRES
jgi:hypothetical protein